MAKALDVEAVNARTERLRLQDQLDDILHGFRHWREVKDSTMEWSTTDEMFARWMERHEHD